MALTTSKFREDFELRSCTGVPPLDSPPFTDLRAEMGVATVKSRTPELLNF
jgi:hypothetical protein